MGSNQRKKGIYGIGRSLGRYGAVIQMGTSPWSVEEVGGGMIRDLCSGVLRFRKLRI